IDPGVHSPALRINARDAVGLPDVGVDLSLNVFELIEFVDLAPVVLDPDNALHLEGVGVQEADLIRPVAHDQRTSIVREPPAFSRVIEPTDQVERVEVINESLLRLPSQLV